MKALLVSFVVGVLMCQLVACNSDGAESAANKEPTANALPVLLVRQSSSSSSSSGSSSSGSSSSGGSKPDFWLIWLQPYEGMIPKPMMDAINQNVRPQTEQITSQVLSQVPGAEEFWSSISQFQNTLSNMGGLQSVLSGAMGGGSGGSSSSSGSSGGLSSIMSNLGRR